MNSSGGKLGWGKARCGRECYGMSARVWCGASGHGLVR